MVSFDVRSRDSGQGYGIYEVIRRDHGQITVLRTYEGLEGRVLAYGHAALAARDFEQAERMLMQQDDPVRSYFLFGDDGT